MNLRESVAIIRRSPGRTSYSPETLETVAIVRAIVAPPSITEQQLTAALGVRLSASVVFPIGTDVRMQDELQVAGHRLRVVQVQPAIRKVIALGEEVGSGD